MGEGGVDGKMMWEKVRSNTAAVMLVIIGAKLLGMARDIVLANYFGTSAVSDAYFIAISVPATLFFIIGNAISTAHLPMYNKVKQERGVEAADRYSSNLTCAALAVCTVLILVLVICPRFVVRVFAAGFDEETVTLAAQLVQSSAVGLYFMVLVSVWSGYLQTRKNFMIPASVSVPRNIVIVLSIVAAAKTTNLLILGVGILAAYGAECLLLVPFIVRSGYRFKPRFERTNSDLQETLYLVLPMILSIGVGRINKIIDKSIASTITEGGISALTYAATLNGAVQEVLVTGVIAILFANCSALVAAGEFRKVKEQLSRTMQALVTLLIPASVGVMILAEPIVAVIMHRGTFDQASLQMTAAALRCYTVGLVFLALRDTLVKMSYAYRDTKTTMITSTTSIGINIALNLILSRFFGLNGLAAATSIAACSECVMLYIMFNKKHLRLDTKRLLADVFRTVVSAGVMAVGVYGVYHGCSSRDVSMGLSLVISILSGVLIYGCVFVVLNLKKVLRAAKKAMDQRKARTTKWNRGSGNEE